MQLTKQDEAMARGDRGEAARIAMGILVKIGEACGAERMVDVTRCHAMASMAPDLHQARIDVLGKFVTLGGRYGVPTTLDPASLDLKKWREFKVPTSYAAEAKKLLQLNEKLGAIPNYSCVPYEQGLGPRFGEFVSFTESSYVVFSNSVLGARANRETQGIIIPASITGRVPLYGLRLRENRVGRVLVKLEGSDPGSFRTVDYAAIGYYLGAKLGHEIPVIDGFKESVTIDQLKVMGASAACKGCVAMYHIVGITPEARTLEEALAGQRPKEIIQIGPEDIKRTCTEISTTAGGEIDAVFAGCPHYSISELQTLSLLLGGKRIHRKTKFFVYTNRETKSLADRMGITRTIEKSGAYVSVGTCQTLSPMKYWGFDTIMTDSPKCAYTCPADIGADAIFGSTEQCVEAAVKGEA